jgi:hypothetical protein
MKHRACRGEMGNEVKVKKIENGRRRRGEIKNGRRTKVARWRGMNLGAYGDRE